MFQKLEGILQAQVPVDLPRGAALVERIKMNAGHAGIQQLRTLAGGVLDAYLLNGVRIGAGAFQRPFSNILPCSLKERSVSGFNETAVV